MRPLIDADMLLYECASIGEYPKDEPIKSFDFVREVFDNKIKDICLAVEATEEPTLYLTGSTNFRDDIAVTQPYKGTRKEEKPFHYDNLKAYIRSLPNHILTDGIEADDAITIEHCLGDDMLEDLGQLTPDQCHTVVCTRDKDVRISGKWQYGWECGRQPEFKKKWCDPVGFIELSKDRKSIKGWGLKLFYSQLLTGDTVDHIPGLVKYGPVAALKVLGECNTEELMFHNVRTHYIMQRPDDWDTYLLEQGRLLWMVKELDDDGQPVMWEFPNV